MKDNYYQQSKVTTPLPHREGLGVGLLGLLRIDLLLLLLLFIYSCTPSLPDHYEEASWQLSPDLFSPNNFGATLPPNIAPLNFRIMQGDASKAVTRIHSRKGGEIIVGGWEVCFKEKAWHRLLDQTRGDTLFCDIYMKAYGQWYHLPTQHFLIAEEDIDPYITYRLIRPSYVTYEELTINERCLENFDERVVYENMRFEDSDRGQCINCHVPRNWNRDAQSQFHVRQALGGTVFIHGSEVTKVNLKTDSTLSAGVYPAWHPTQNLIAYSVNETGQVFHTLDPQKVEVIDYASDLILYDLDKNTVQHIDHTASEFESFPTWSPDGNTLYYISAHYTPRADDIDADLDTYYDQLHYNVYARDFDQQTRRFGPRRLIFDAEAIDKSASQPRVSPDGQYLLFTLADYGQFHIWHKSAELAIMRLNSPNPSLTPDPSPNGEESDYLSGENAADKVYTPISIRRGVGGEAGVGTEAIGADSYHSWSSNGRWILFSSRRDDGNYTRLYISYFDKDGRTHKPFRLPQRSPDSDDLLLRSYNAAEFSLQPVRPSQRQLRKAIKADARPATYAGSALAHPEADSIAARPPRPDADRRGEAVGY